MPLGLFEITAFSAVFPTIFEVKTVGKSMKIISTTKQEILFKSQLYEVSGFLHAKYEAASHLSGKVTNISNIDEVYIKFESVGGYPVNGIHESFHLSFSFGVPPGLTVSEENNSILFKKVKKKRSNISLRRW